MGQPKNVSVIVGILSRLILSISLSKQILSQGRQELNYCHFLYIPVFVIKEMVKLFLLIYIDLNN